MGGLFVSWLWKSRCFRPTSTRQDSRDWLDPWKIVNVECIE